MRASIKWPAIHAAVLVGTLALAPGLVHAQGGPGGPGGPPGQDGGPGQGGGQQGHGHRSGPESPADKAAREKVCSLLSPSDLTSVFKTDIGQGQGGGGGGRGKSTCDFVFSDGSSRSVKINLYTGDGARALYLQRKSSGEHVFGLGEDSFWVTSFSTLWVLTRDGSVVELDLTTASSAIRHGDAKSTATELGRKAISHL